MGIPVVHDTHDKQKKYLHIKNNLRFIKKRYVIYKLMFNEICLLLISVKTKY